MRVKRCVARAAPPTPSPPPPPPLLLVLPRSWAGSHDDWLGQYLPAVAAVVQGHSADKQQKQQKQQKPDEEEASSDGSRK